VIRIRVKSEVLNMVNNLQLTVAPTLPALLYVPRTAGHNRQWFDGLILIVSIDTIGFIFLWCYDPSVKDFLFLIDRIDYRS
jgi:hypothetical protein